LATQIKRADLACSISWSVEHNKISIAAFLKGQALYTPHSASKSLAQRGLRGNVNKGIVSVIGAPKVFITVITFDNGFNRYNYISITI